MAGGYDTSFVDGETEAVQLEHRRLLEMLCRGEQPEFVPAFSACVPRIPITGPYDREAWLIQALAELREKATSFRDRHTYRPFALSLARYDLHFSAAIAGCPIRHDETPYVWCTSLEKLGRQIDDFSAPDLDSHDEFQEMSRLLRFVEEATEGRIPIEIPYVSEPLILAVDLFGEEFLYLLAADPDRANRFLDKITAFILDMRRRLYDVVPQAPVMPHGSCHRVMPEGYNLLFGCTTQLISGPAYERHFLDRDRELMRCAATGGGMHLCGRHTQFCTSWHDMPELKMIQLNDQAAVDLETYWRNLRSDQYIVLMTDAAVTVDDAVRITGGRQLVLSAEVGERIPVA